MYVHVHKIILTPYALWNGIVFSTLTDEERGPVWILEKDWQIDTQVPD